MPTNEILAPYFATVVYRTSSGLPQHQMRFFFNYDATLPENFEDKNLVTSLSYFTAYGSLTLGNAIKRVFDALAGQRASTSTIDAIDVFQGNVTGLNPWIGSITPPVLAAGSGAPKAAATTSFVWKGTGRQKYRFTVADAHDTAPQRFGGGTGFTNANLANLKTEAFGWMMTSDGQPLSLLMSVNTGYNRRLAKSYGRELTP